MKMHLPQRFSFVSPASELPDLAWCSADAAVRLPLLTFAFDALGANPWLVASAAGATALVAGRASAHTRHPSRRLCLDSNGLRFALYARQYWPWLTRPRIDGKAG